MKPQRAQRLERLVDANPRWTHYWGDESLCLITFDCPIHEECVVHSLPFSPALDGKPCPASHEAKAWGRAGDTFETLTLSPSIRRMDGPTGCEWHGFIRDGRFEHCDDSR